MSSVSFAAIHAAHLLRRHRWHAGDSRPWSVAEWTNALCGEAGEAANVAKKLLRSELGAPGNGGVSEVELRDKLARELADVVHYAIITAERAGLDLEQALCNTFNEKSEQLGFPERLSPDPIKVDQRPNGCTTACIATLTGIPLAELPAPPEDADETWFESDENRNSIHVPMYKALAARGWLRVHCWKHVPAGFAVAGGTSPRGVAHSVVVKDGQLWHDPHPSRAGLVGAIEGYEILVPLAAPAVTG